jgi:hypothetical protein
VISNRKTNLCPADMSPGKKIFLTVTNNLVYDQRMQRICVSLASAGYRVTLVGCDRKGSPPLSPMPFQQVRLPIKNEKGKLFYLEYNYKLYKYLVNEDMDALCAIDLDTIVPVYLASKKKGIPRMYDAHEFFTEMIEVKRRPHIHYVWKQIEKWLVPKFQFGYTVGQAIADDLKQLYGVRYVLVRNMPHFTQPLNIKGKLPPLVTQIMEAFNEKCSPDLPIVLYQGAINEGRALHALADAMRSVNGRLLLAGDGNLETELKAYIEQIGMEHKIFMCGMVPPADLRYLTALCDAGITIFDAYSKNQYYSLANKFFDYIMAQKPQVCVNYPEYAAILKQFPVAVTMEDTQPGSIARSLNKLLEDHVLYKDLKNICNIAAQELNWEKEEQKLLETWNKLFSRLQC